MLAIILLFAGDFPLVVEELNVHDYHAQASQPTRRDIPCFAIHS